MNLTRDKQHRVKQMAYPADAGGAAFNVDYTFDEFGRIRTTTDLSGVSTLTFDDLGRIYTVVPTLPSTQKTLTFTYAADTSLQRWSTTVNVNGVGNFVYREDSKGRLSEVLNPYQASSFWFEYDPDGKNTLLRHPNGSGGLGVQEVRSYNTRDWLETLEIRPFGWTSGQPPQDRFTYLYGAAGNLLSETDLGGRVHGFVYDNLYRLISESHLDFGTGGIQYQYDRNGNRTQRTVNGVTEYYGIHPNLDRLEWVNQGSPLKPTSGQANPYTLFSYDLVGRLTQRERKTSTTPTRTYDFLWDAEDRLRQVKQGASSIFTALYDGDGLRVNKWDTWTLNHDFAWGPGGVITDSNGSGTTYTPGLAHRKGTTDRFYHSDWLGSTRLLSDSGGTGFPSQLRYDAFGNRSATTGGDPYHSTDFQFAGGWGYQREYADETISEPGLGLQYLEQRYYDPVVGRFISADPIGFSGDLNLYAYAFNNPVDQVDPSGLDVGWARRPRPNDPYGDDRLNRVQPQRPARRGMSPQCVDMMLNVDATRGTPPIVPEFDVSHASATVVIAGAMMRRRPGIIRNRQYNSRVQAALGGDYEAQTLIRAANYLASRGYRVFLRTRSIVPRRRTSDFLLNGVPYDLYSPATNVVGSIVRGIRNKNDQARGIILDLSQTSVTREQLWNVLYRVRRAGGTNIEHIIFLP